MKSDISDHVANLTHAQRLKIEDALCAAVANGATDKRIATVGPALIAAIAQLNQVAPAGAALPAVTHKLELALEGGDTTAKLDSLVIGLLHAHDLLGQIIGNQALPPAEKTGS